MRASLLVLAVGLAVVPARAGAGSDAAHADLAKVARTIGKEPVYQTKAPRYCLLVFGREAKFRVWLVQDGDVLYVDRNGNGDLTESGKRVEKKDGAAGGRRFELGELRDGTLRHRIDSVMEMTMTPESVGDAKEFARLKGSHHQAINTWISVEAERSAGDDRKLPRHIKYIVNGDGQGYLSFADRPQDAPIVHLNGSWTFGLQDIKQHLVAGQKTMLQLGVGTPGVGPGTFAFVRYPNTIPSDAHPKGEIAFPGADPGNKSVAAPVTFKKRC